MSIRLMKKVLKEQEATAKQQDFCSDDDPESPHVAPAGSSINPFDLLLDDNNDQENESEMTGEHYTVSSEYEERPAAKAFTNAVLATNHKSKKNKKKKNKGDAGSCKKNNEDPLDVIMSQNLSFGVDSSSLHFGLSKAKPASNISGSIPGKKISSSILQIDPKFLNAENELRRIFGSKVVNSFEKSHQTGTSRQIHGGRRGSHNHRKTVLITPSDHWPRWDGSLSMEFLETRDGYHYFRYMQTSSYGQAQGAFEAAKAIHDLNGIANILLYHPYHIDSLITLAEYFKFSGDHQMSADATSKCLYALECAWHPMFTPFQGNCQLKYSHETNKPLFSTLFAHMKNMDRRGCHRCALEICKLLLSLDSEDPMGAMFCIDYFSLRAEEYTWLEQFSEEYKSDNSLWLFPNFSFSLAICRFFLEHSKDMKEGEKAASTDLMSQALMLHPPVLKKLVTKVPLKDQIWTKILKHNFFAADQTGIPSLDHLINIYVERSYIIWRLPDLHKFLRDAAIKVIEKMDNNLGDAKDWTCVREESFSSEKNEYSHLFLSDFSDSVPTMPPELLQNFMVDPRVMENQNADQLVHPNEGARAPRDVANRNALAVLFESLLPWNHYGAGGVEGGGQHDEDEQNN